MICVVKVKFLTQHCMPIPKSSFIQRMVRWRFLIVLNIFVIVFLGISFGREIIRNHSIGSEIARLQEQADSLAAKNIEISELKTAIQTESYIEREARLKLGMKKPGETVYVIQEQTQDQSQTATTDDPNDPLGLVIQDSEDAEAVANPTKWWYYFFDKQSYNTFRDL